jgi:photosystem II stability/assembly factor-like uncharacterized protein
VNTIFTRKRVVVIAIVAAFIAVFAAVGLVSKSTPAVAVGGAKSGGVPFVPWYWAMVVSPSDPNVLVLSTNNGIYRSSNGGKTWQVTGLTGKNVTSLVQSGDSIYAGGAPMASTASPVVRKGGARTAADGSYALAVSTDAGKTWKDLHPRGLPNITVQALAVDPAGSTALYALLNNGGLYRSTDGAQSFQLFSASLGVAPWAIAITHAGHFIAGDMDGGSHVSANGKVWQQVPFKDSSGGRMVMDYAVQPTDATRVLMTSRGIEISTDGGKTWHVALNSTVMFGPVAWAASKPGVAFAIGFDGSLWRSDNAGKSWKKVS